MDTTSKQQCDFLLSYDVRAYYTTEQTEADANYLIIFGNYNPSVNEDVNIFSIQGVPQEFTITNYPNPFNPSTTIKYDITNPGITKLNVYNVNGELITKLVDK